jgi:hypothetical protein
MIRDDEIQRLIHYAKGLGTKVVIYNKDNPGASAEWTIDGSAIEVYSKGMTKTDIVLALIHELGHHVWFIHEKNRQPDLKFEEAIDRENLVQEVADKKNLTPKHLRKKIYDMELAGTEWWSTIVADTGIKLPEWKIKMQMEFDMYMYEQYYENGVFPRRKDKIVKLKDLKEKWKPRGKQ